MTTFWGALPRTTRTRYLRKHESVDFLSGIVFVPIHASNHWQCAVVSPVPRRACDRVLYGQRTTHIIRTYCSLGGSVDVKELKSWMITENDPCVVEVHSIAGPRQENMYDCGMFMLYFWFTICGWKHPDMYVSPGEGPISSVHFGANFRHHVFDQHDVSKLRSVLLNWISRYNRDEGKMPQSSTPSEPSYMCALSPMQTQKQRHKQIHRYARFITQHATFE